MIEKRKQNAKLGQWLNRVEDVPLFSSQLIFYETMKTKLHHRTFSFSLCNKNRRHLCWLATCDYTVVIYPRVSMCTETLCVYASAAI